MNATGETAQAARGSDYQHEIDRATEIAAGRLTARAAGLDAHERETIVQALRSSLDVLLHQRLGRVLLVELNAARLRGLLTAPTEDGRWREFLDTASKPAYLTALSSDYPHLERRMRKSVHHRVDAAVELGERFATDRERGLFDHLVPGDQALRGVHLGLGDSHRRGRMVARLELAGGNTWYKPRPLDADLALAALLADLEKCDVRVPNVIRGDGYGWAEHIAHRQCADDDEERRFYHGLGYWQAIMLLLGGSDLHGENVIADGPTAVVVDCETLFGPPVDAPAGLPDALARAGRAVETALRTCLLPSRTWLDGLDLSPSAALPGQQPKVIAPLVADAGTDRARVVLEEMTGTPLNAQLASATPRPALFWDDLVAGFQEGTEQLQRLGSDGRRAAVRRFAGAQLRLVPRDTQTYVEFIRTLWHPRALRDEQDVVAQVDELLTKHTAHNPWLPADPAIRQAEIADLVDGDVPVFSFQPELGQVTGPGGVPAGEHGDLLAAALDSWERRSLVLDEVIIRMSLANAYQDHIHTAHTPVAEHRTGNETTRARTLAAALVSDLCRSGIRGDDGTVAWVGTVLTRLATTIGTTVAALPLHLYDGQAGVVVALSAYGKAVEAGFAEPVADLAATRDGAVRTLTRAVRAEHDAVGRLVSPGGYDGAGGIIWSGLTLHEFGVPEGLDLALLAATGLASTIGEDQDLDLMHGSAGAIVPLLGLAERTGNIEFTELAELAARHLAKSVARDGGRATWATATQQVPLGGIAHGATGIGWALARLALVTGDSEWRALADEAFAFEDSLYDATDGGWKYAARRDQPALPAQWCHGSVGIGLAALDLHRRTGAEAHLDRARRAAAHTQATGFGRGHTPCHGDVGAWEFLTTFAPHVGDERGDHARVLTSIEDHGVVVGVSAQATAPGLLNGVSGVVYQLLRMAGMSDLPSFLLLEA